MREGNCQRQTSETDIHVEVALDGSGNIRCDTEVGFFNHLLNAFALHGGLDLKVQARGDLEVDAHHLIEDVGICLGRAFSRAFDAEPVQRFGQAVIPMDDALVGVYVDVGGRSYLGYHLDLPPRSWGCFHSDHFREFLRAFVAHSKTTLHVKREAGSDCHHLLEAASKALGRSLKQATLKLDSEQNIPSTKGSLRC